MRLFTSPKLSIIVVYILILCFSTLWLNVAAQDYTEKCYVGETEIGKCSCAAYQSCEPFEMTMRCFQNDREFDCPDQDSRDLKCEPTANPDDCSNGDIIQECYDPNGELLQKCSCDAFNSCDDFKMKQKCFRVVDDRRVEVECENELEPCKATLECPCFDASTQKEVPCSCKEVSSCETVTINRQCFKYGRPVDCPLPQEEIEFKCEPTDDNKECITKECFGPNGTPVEDCSCEKFTSCDDFTLNIKCTSNGEPVDCPDGENTIKCPGNPQLPECKDVRTVCYNSRGRAVPCVCPEQSCHEEYLQVLCYRDRVDADGNTHAYEVPCPSDIDTEIFCKPTNCGSWQCVVDGQLVRECCKDCQTYVTYACVVNGEIVDASYCNIKEHPGFSQLDPTVDPIKQPVVCPWIAENDQDRIAKCLAVGCFDHEKPNDDDDEPQPQPQPSVLLQDVISNRSRSILSSKLQLANDSSDSNEIKPRPSPNTIYHPSFDNFTTECPCRETCRGYVQQLYCLFNFDGEWMVVPNEFCKRAGLEIERKCDGNPKLCNKYSYQCKQISADGNNVTYGPCGCDAFVKQNELSGCYNFTIVPQCFEHSTEAPAPVPVEDEFCQEQGLLPPNPQLCIGRDCGKWTCTIYTEDGELYLDYHGNPVYGPCDCDKIRHYVRAAANKKAASAAQTHYKEAPCFEFTTKPVCVKADGTIDDSGAACASVPPPEVDELECPCEDPEKEGTWLCTFTDSISGHSYLGPCDHICERTFYLFQNDPHRLCKGIEYTSVCTIDGIVVDNSLCDEEDRPLFGEEDSEFGYCRSEKHCEYIWMCKVDFNGEIHTIPCSDIPIGCDRYREIHPCGFPKIELECHAYGGVVVSNSLCPPPEPTYEMLLAVCPERDGCDDPIKNEWKCYAEDVDGVLHPLPSCRPCSFRSCYRYVSLTRCEDADGNVLPDAACDPATRPFANVTCPANLTGDDCNPQSECQYLCTIKGHEYQQFPCSDSQDVCIKYGIYDQCEDVIVIVNCYRHDPRQGFVIDESGKCCDREQHPFPDHEGNEIDCPKILEGTFDFDSLADSYVDDKGNAIIVKPDRNCKYGWVCTNPITGAEVPCHAPCEERYRKDCQEYYVIAQCFRYTPHGTIPVDASYCNNSPNLEPIDPDTLYCPPLQGCDDEFTWLCVDNDAGVGYHNTGDADYLVPCADACKVFGVNHCTEFYIDARCFQVYPTFVEVWNEWECYSRLGDPFTHHPFSHDVCPPGGRDCDPTVDDKYHRRCYLNGILSLEVPCDISCDDKRMYRYYRKLGCKLTIEPRCVRDSDGAHVDNEYCVEAGFDEDEFEPRTCEDCPTKGNWVCHRSDGTAVKCDAPCRFTSDCDLYTVTAQCVDEFGNILPDENCGAYPDIFDSSNTHTCIPRGYSKHCHYQWHCSAEINQSQTALVPCNEVNYCSIYPFASRCQRYKVRDFCVYTDPVTNTPSVVSPTYCEQLNVPNPVPNHEAYCPSVLPSDCFTLEPNPEPWFKYQWMCHFAENGHELPHTEPQLCSPKDDHCAQFNTQEYCGKTILGTAYCYQVSSNPFTLEPTYTLVESSNCNIAHYPMINHNLPVNISCQGPTCRRCKNGAINPPLCNIFVAADPVVAWPSKKLLTEGIPLSWAYNTGKPVRRGDDKALPVEDVFITLTNDDFPYGVTVAVEKANREGGYFPLPTYNKPASMKLTNDDEGVQVTATVHTRNGAKTTSNKVVVPSSTFIDIIEGIDLCTITRCPSGSQCVINDKKYPECQCTDKDDETCPFNSGQCVEKFLQINFNDSIETLITYVFQWSAAVGDQFAFDIKIALEHVRIAKINSSSVIIGLTFCEDVEQVETIINTILAIDFTSEDLLINSSSAGPSAGGIKSVTVAADNWYNTDGTEPGEDDSSNNAMMVVTSSCVIIFSVILALFAY